MKRQNHISTICGLCFFLVFAMILTADVAAKEKAPSNIEKLPDGKEMAKKINARNFGTEFSRIIKLELINKNGKVRSNRLREFRKFKPDATYLAFYILAPPENKDTAFLCYDYFDSKKHDGQWLYRPSRDRTRRIPETNRNNDFLGSDFSIEDIKKIYRVEIDEYRWKTIEKRTTDGITYFLVEQVPVTSKLAKSIGYSRILNHIDSRHGIRTKIEFWDIDSAPLKTIEAKEIIQEEGVWIARRIEALNHKTGNRSVMHIESTDIKSPVPDEVFTIRNIEKRNMK
jgi:hypothetical protein